MSGTGPRQLVLAGLLTLALSAPAAAAVRYASPNGGGAEPCSSHVDPCTLEQAVSGSDASSDIVVLPGDYTIYSELDPAAGATIEGELGKARPRILAGGDYALTLVGGVARRLEVESMFGVPGIHATDGAILDELEVYGWSRFTVNLEGAVLRDSILMNEDPGAPVVKSLSGTNTVVGSTVVAANGGTAIEASGYCAPPADQTSSGCDPTASTTSSIRVRDTIARAGGGHDLVTSADTGYGGSIAVSYSDYDPLSVNQAGDPIDASGGHNMSSEPLFVKRDDPYQNLHELPASPTVDAGATDGALGPADFDGEPRVQGAAPDIGADECAPAAPAAQTDPASGVTETSATVRGAVGVCGVSGTVFFSFGRTASYGQQTRPVALPAHDGAVPAAALLPGLTPGTTFHYRVVTQSSRGTATGADRTFRTTAAAAAPLPPVLDRLRIAPATFRAGRRARVSYRLSLAGRSSFRVERRRGRRWTRVRGTLQHRDKRGANAWTFRGRIGGRKLAPGSYRLVAAPRSAAGLLGRAVRVAFRIKR